MKILFCLGSMKKGGAERVAANLCNKLIDSNDVLMVLTSSVDSDYELNKKINIEMLDKKQKSNNILVRTINRIKELRKITKNYKPDIIISFLPEPTLRVLIANFFNSNKILISVRNDPKIEYNNLFKKLIAKTLFIRANGIIFQTEEAMNFFPKFISKRAEIIPNPINEQFIGEPYLGERNNHIVNVGRLNEQKNQKNLLLAFSHLYKKYDVQLYIYGDGEIKDELIQYSKDLKISDYVHFEGNVDNLKEKIYDSKMFVLSSDYEGMPNSLMEAMALGLPCISTDCPCGGPRFLIENNKNGLLVPVNDSQKLAEAIEYILNNENIGNNFGIQANKICERLNPQKIYNLWYDYIICLVNKK